MNISNNVASIQTQQTIINKSADAIANINAAPTDGSNVQKQTDLAQEIPKQIVAQNAVEVNATVIKTADDMLGSLLDIKA